MFILGHVGLTIGLILFGIMIFKKDVLIDKIDFRIIALFALLPDFIDKIIGHVFFQDTLNNGRLFSHTLIFLVAFCVIFFFVVGTYWWIYSIPIVTHQVFDTLWESPATWFWPGFGWSFKSLEIDVWHHWLTTLLNNPFIIFTEILGFVIIISITIFYKIYKYENFKFSLKTGRLKK